MSRDKLSPYWRNAALWAMAIAVTAVLAITGALIAELRWLHYLCKPLATLLVAALVWTALAADRRYRGAILAGLLLSTLGDVFLMLPFDGFVYGLGSFLLAHLVYLFAFTRWQRLATWRWPFLVYALAAGGVLTLLWPGLPPALKLPVLIYVAALAAMAAQAAVLALARTPRHARFAAWGGLSFVVSDALLALDRFHTPITAAPLWVLASYWIAQYLIGRSVEASRA